MNATHGIASQRGKSGAVKLALKVVIVVVFGAAVLAIARAPVEIGDAALATTGQADRTAVASPAENVGYFPREFPDVRGDIEPLPDTF